MNHSLLGKAYAVFILLAGIALVPVGFWQQEKRFKSATRMYKDYFKMSDEQYAKKVEEVRSKKKRTNDIEKNKSNFSIVKSYTNEESDE